VLHTWPTQDMVNLIGKRSSDRLNLGLLPVLAPNGLAREFRLGPVLKVDQKSWAPSRMTRLIRLESPESIAMFTNLAAVLPLMTETDSELQSLLPQ
jgi:hypothetical protein